MEDNKKIWDMTFKTLLLETPKLFLPLIKEVFGTEYSKEKEIVLLNNEYYNKDGTKIIADMTFCIIDKKYHFECQFKNDTSMVFRMFEYDFHIGAAKIKETKEYLEFEFPKSCVVYLTANKKNPTKLKMKLNFPNGESIEYQVPTIRVQDYSIEDIENKNLSLFTPFLILRYADKLRNKIKPTKEEIYGLYKKIIQILNRAYEQKEINEIETSVLLETIKQTEEYVLENYVEYKKGVDIMLSETLELKTVQAIKKAQIAAKIEGKIEGKEEAIIEIIKNMYQDGLDISYIKKLAEKQNITQEELEKILGIHIE